MAFLLVSILDHVSSDSGQALDFEGDEKSQVLIDDQTGKAVLLDVLPWRRRWREIVVERQSQLDIRLG